MSSVAKGDGGVRNLGNGYNAAVIIRFCTHPDCSAHLFPGESGNLTQIPCDRGVERDLVADLDGSEHLWLD